MSYHTVIAKENRTSTPDKPRQLAIDVQSQLHSMGDSISNITNANILYAATWDGVSPWIVVEKGSIADLKMAYMGFPMIDKATWDAANPQVKPI